MRELTIHEIEAELAEQLPARELMGSCYQPCNPCCPCPPPPCFHVCVTITVGVGCN